jgi:hypothetical protein
MDRRKRESRNENRGSLGTKRFRLPSDVTIQRFTMQRNAAAFTPPHSRPGALYNNRTTDKPYATAPCCRIAHIYSDAAHASDWLPFECAAASLRSYVWERPWLASRNQSRKREKGNRCIVAADVLIGRTAAGDGYIPSPLQLQFIQRAPIRFRLAILGKTLHFRRLTDTPAVAIATWIGRQI